MRVQQAKRLGDLGRLLRTVYSTFFQVNLGILAVSVPEVT
jgi:hypothetical protein